MARLAATRTFEEAQKRLAAIWIAASDEWRDEVARRFDREYWTQLDAAASRYQQAIEELETVIERLENEI
jgi:exonuclease VII small subunit